MARTAPPAAQPTATPDPTPPPAPAAPAPVPATAAWPSPPPPPTFDPAPATPHTDTSDTPTKTRRPARGGLPVGPALATAGNATALTLTTALHYAGPVGAATTGAIMAAGIAATALRQHATARRNLATRSTRTGATNGATPTSRGGYRGATKGATPRAGSATTAGSGAPRHGATGRGTPRHGATRSGGATPSASGARGATNQRHGATGWTLRTNGKNRRHATATGSVAPGATKAPRPATPRHGATTPHGAAHGLRNSNHPSVAGRGRHGTIKAALGRATRAAATGTRATGRMAARGATAAWKATAPLRAAATRQLALAAATAARQARRVPAQLLHAALATSAGLLTALWKRSPSAGCRRLIDVWKRLRARSAAKAKAETPTPDTPDTLAPPVTDSVRQPHHPTPTTPPGGTLMTGGHHFLAPAMEMHRLAEAYEPTGMLQVGADFATLPEALYLHAEAMKVTLEKADAHWPVDPAIVDLLGQIHALQMRAAEMARELTPAFEQLHEVDLTRLHNPRKSAQAEAMWDVSRNL